MKRLLLVCILLYFSFDAFAQPAIQWQKIYGGSGNDNLTQMLPTPDGGYILSGLSNSPVGVDKSSPTIGGLDHWLTKISALGIKEWDKTLGSQYDDGVNSVVPAIDGGYLSVRFHPIGGNSPMSSLTTGKLWFNKMNQTGDVEWEKELTVLDNLHSISKVKILATQDNSYVLVLNSFIEGGYENEVRSYILKITKDAQIIWMREVSSTWVVSLSIASDGGYLVGMDVGGYDQVFNEYDMLKIAPNGDRMWEQGIGGRDNGRSILTKFNQTRDGGYILVGASDVGITNQKSERSYGMDYWVVKLNADHQTIEWEKTLSTEDYDDQVFDVVEKEDGSFIVLGTSSGPLARDKTEANRGYSDLWVVKLSSNGKKIWDKTIGGNGNEGAVQILNTADGGTIIGAISNSPTSFEKQQPSYGGNDFWVVKLASENTPLPETIIRINAGGPDFATATKKLFIADKFYAGIDRTSSIASGDILNTTNDALYRSGRSSPSFSYNIPVVNGQVNVTLHFAETYFGAPGKKGGAGSRRFHVNIEGSRKLTNYDIFSSAGGALRAVQTTIPVTVLDGVLNIDFLTGAADQPRVCAIEVVATSLTLTPIADAYVRDGSFSTTNFNVVSNLDIKTSSADPSANRNSYLKFQMPLATTIGTAKLRIYGRNHENMKPISLHAYGVNNDSWTEGSITKANAPAASTASLGFVPVTDVYQYYEIDVTSYVKAQQQSGGPLVSLLLRDPNNRNTRLVFNSKEAPSFPPQLIIQTTTNSTARLSQEELLIEKQEVEPSTVFPNPVKDYFTISLSTDHSGPISFELSNALGRGYKIPAVKNAKPGEDVKLSILDLLESPGIYLLKIKSDTFTETTKILVTK